MEILDDIRNWIDKNSNWLTIILLLLLVFKTCTCHNEIVTLLGGGKGHHLDKKKGGSSCGSNRKKKLGGNSASKPLVIKLFWVDWCGHCNKFKPVWNKLKRENTEDVNYVDVNCEKEKELANNEGIQGFPTIRLYDSEGTLLEELVWARDEDNIKNLIKNNN